MCDKAEVVENFYGVYILYCINPKFRGRTYIGFTTDPNRRIKQHNKGQKAGGAFRTSNKGPWEMVLIVHGFPNDISALRAGMEPPVHMPIAYGPVKPSKVKNSEETIDVLQQDDAMCLICKGLVKQSDIMRCLSSSCPLIAHIRCLASHMLQRELPGTILPLEGSCPSCGITMLWGDLVRLKRGCYQLTEDVKDEHWAEALSQIT
ncbi:hypothetical protein OTU49_017089 [Cherax quadricarinatus]